ncbi:hypothetical protein, partial [Kingella oralis]
MRQPETAKPTFRLPCRHLCFIPAKGSLKRRSNGFQAASFTETPMNTLQSTEILETIRMVSDQNFDVR